MSVSPWSSVTKKCASGRADTLVYRVQTGGGRQVGPVRYDKVR